jgi:5-methylcytosine-specific restriction endonuclease McrA
MSRHRAAYRQYLQSKTWDRLRRRTLKRYRYRCALCDEALPLDVHHRRYPARWGTEKASDLIALCEKCHEAITSELRARGGGGFSGRTVELAAAKVPELKVSRV